LEGKISEYQANEMKLKGRIFELETKNAALLDSSRHSPPSTNKMNELNSRLSQENPENETLSRSLSKKMISPQTSLQFTSIKRKINLINSGSEQTSYESSYASESRSRLLNLGCVSTSPKSITSLRGSSREEQ
jgi:hypothetical protein